MAELIPIQMPFGMWTPVGTKKKKPVLGEDQVPHNGIAIHILLSWGPIYKTS